MHGFFNLRILSHQVKERKYKIFPFTIQLFLEIAHHGSSNLNCSGVINIYVARLTVIVEIFYF